MTEGEKGRTGNKKRMGGEERERKGGKGEKTEEISSSTTYF